MTVDVVKNITFCAEQQADCVPDTTDFTSFWLYSMQHVSPLEFQTISGRTKERGLLPQFLLMDMQALRWL